MTAENFRTSPAECPSCSGPLEITRLQCQRCGTEVAGHFDSQRLVNLPEPFASVLEMFLRVRGNVKDMERELGLSYPTVRSRLEEAFRVAGFDKNRAATAEAAKAERLSIIHRLNEGDMSPSDAIEQLRKIKDGRPT